jgi:predicted dienelactone hydrolase
MRAFAAAIIASLIIGAEPAEAIGFQQVTISNPGGNVIEAGIWYPSDTPATPSSPQSLPQTVATNGDIAGINLPVIVFSHGSSGWFAGHADYARALASAGFIVIAVTHSDDNYKVGNGTSLKALISRPRDVHLAIDFMTNNWNGRTHIDPSKIGIFGFSAGGFTALVAIGGVPDFKRFTAHCAEAPQEFTCQEAFATALSGSEAINLPEATWIHDRRIKAAVLAAPGFAYAFDPDSLRRINLPVQLWNGAEDPVIPVETNLAYLHRTLPNVVDYEVIPGAAHYSFLAPCNDGMREKLSELCGDAPGFDRAALHERMAQSMIAFFRAQLHTL